VGEGVSGRVWDVGGRVRERKKYKRKLDREREQEKYTMPM